MGAELAGVPAALLLLALVRGLIWTLALPPWYGPDEHSHFAYVQMLAVQGRAPEFGAVRDDGGDVPEEISCSQHNLGFRRNGPFFSQPLFGPDPDPCPQDGSIEDRVPEWPTSPAAAYSPLFYAVGVPFYMLAWPAEVETRLAAVRLLSVALGVVAVALTYLTARRIFGPRRPLLVAVGVVAALQPMASQQFSTVSNDALLFALAALYFWLFSRSLARGPALADAALLGVSVGLGYLAKPQGLLLAATIPILLVGGLYRHRAGVRRLAAFAAVFGLAAAAFVVGGAVWNALSHGAAIPQLGPEPAFVGFRGYFAALAERNFEHLHWLLVVSAWGHFAWFTVGLPPVVFALIAATYAIAAVGLVLALAHGRYSRSALFAAVVSAAVVVVLLLTLEAVYYRSYARYILQGRAFLEVLPLLAISLVAGLAAWVPSRCERWVCGGAVVLMFALNAYSLMVLAEAFYG
jgi:4-amino-4-deoxy-L-arabinose transferase-like glycosyltransferase